MSRWKINDTSDEKTSDTLTSEHKSLNVRRYTY